MKKLILTIILSSAVMAQVAAPTLSKDFQQQRTILLLRQEILNRDIADFLKSVMAAYPGYALNEQGLLVKFPSEDKK